MKFTLKRHKRGHSGILEQSLRLTLPKDPAPDLVDAPNSTRSEYTQA